MSELRPGKLVRVHLSEHDRVGGRHAFEVLVDKCRELGVSGASVFRGIEGFGGSSEILRPRMWNGDQPIVVTVVESAEVVERILPELRSLVPDAMIAISDVRMLRIQRSQA
jgi:uncharacterized protein